MRQPEMCYPKESCSAWGCLVCAQGPGLLGSQENKEKIMNEVGREALRQAAEKLKKNGASSNQNK